MKPGVAGFVLRCQDIEATMAFYENVLGFDRFEPAPGMPFRGAARYHLGPIVFEIMPGGPDVAPPGDRHDVPMTPMLDVDDIHVAIDELRGKGVRILTEPLQVPGTGSWVASICDPENHHILVAQQG